MRNLGLAQASAAGTVTVGPWSPPIASMAIVANRVMVTQPDLPTPMRRLVLTVIIVFDAQSDNLSPTIVTLRSDVMTPVGFAGGRVNGQGLPA